MLQHSHIIASAVIYKNSVTHNKVRHATEETFFRHIG